MSATNTTSVIAAISPEADAVARPRAAYQRLLAEIDALPDTEFVTINIDIPVSITTALGVLPEIRELEPEAAALPKFDVSSFTKLEDTVLALGHAHTRYLAASSPPEELSTLVAQATEARELLLSNAQTLARHGLIPEHRATELERSLGHRGVAFDLARLVEILREFWSNVEGKTPLSLPMLVEYENLSDRLLTAVGVRDQGPTVVAEATRRRQSAFTLFVRCYNEVRRAISYLRWNHGDLDTIMPSLYAGRRRKSGDNERPAPAPPPTTPPTPSADADDVASAAEPVNVPVGFRGGSPFTS